MKKLVLTALFIMLGVNFLYAQHQTGKNTLGALIGIGGGGLTGTGAIPLAAEFNFYDVNPNIKLGGFAAFASASEDYNWGFGSGEWSYTYIIIAAQGNYHFMPGNKLDPFAGLSIGYNIASASWEWSPVNKNGTLIEPDSATDSDIFWNLQAGLNYWFTDKVAAQVRVGYFPYIGAGVTFAL